MNSLKALCSKQSDDIRDQRQEIDRLRMKQNFEQLEFLVRRQVAKQDQVTQTMVEPVFAVEAQASVEGCDRGCQTFGDHGCQHECCEKEVQTVFSFTKLASVVCWRCGGHGHYRSHCWRKGRKRCFACKKVGHIRRFCPSRVKVGKNQSPGDSENAEATNVLATSEVGVVERWGGAFCRCPSPHPTRARTRGRSKKLPGRNRKPCHEEILSEGPCQFEEEEEAKGEERKREG